MRVLGDARARGGGLARAVGEVLEGGDAVVERQAHVEGGTCEGNKGTKRRHPSTHTMCVRTGAAGVTCLHRHCVRNDDGRAGLRQANPGDHDDLVVERLQPRHVAHLVPDQLRARLQVLTCERFFSSLSPSFSSAQCSAGGRTPNMQRKTR